MTVDRPDCCGNVGQSCADGMGSLLLGQCTSAMRIEHASGGFKLATALRRAVDVSKTDVHQNVDVGRSYCLMTLGQQCWEEGNLRVIM